MLLKLSGRHDKVKKQKNPFVYSLLLRIRSQEDDAEFEYLLHPYGHMNRIEMKYLIIAAGGVIAILLYVMIIKTVYGKRT